MAGFERRENGMKAWTTVGTLLFAMALAAPGASRALELPETGIAYEIEVSLEPTTRRLDGRESIRWTNPQATTVVDRVPLHLYLNAFSHEATTWMSRSLPRGVDPKEILRLYPDAWGWSEPRSIRQGGRELAFSPVAPDDGNPFDRSLVEVVLAEPVVPGETLVLEIDFEARLPMTFARTGGYEDFFLAGQWFPKVAVFETAGVRGAPEDRWNAHQFHGLTEFYAEYADFDVRIGVPPGWTVAATGQGGPEGAMDGDVRWHRYRQRAVHDFAFATGARMVDHVSTHDPAGPGGPVEIRLFLPAGVERLVPRWLEAVEGALDVLGSRVGAYPYATLTAVFPPYRTLEAYGMEYPTLITGHTGDLFWDSAPVSGLRLPAIVLTHEVAHQYFYGLVGSNEFEEAHLDEGFTNYWGHQAMFGTYGEGAAGTLLGRPLDLADIERASQPSAERAMPPLSTRPSFLLSRRLLGTFFSRPAGTLATLAALHGQDAVDRVFAAYFERWRFRHPRLEDFVDVAREVGGDSFADLFEEAYSRTRSPDYAVDQLETARWTPPRGRLVLGSGVVEPDAERTGPLARAGLDPLALEEDGVMSVRILDPGYGGRHEGRIETVRAVPETGEADDGWEPADDETYFVSTVVLAGPAWENLPVEVVLRFADGAVFRETWDGRAPTREYRVIRRAPLSEARVDPEGKIVLDPDRVNNSRRREADRALATDWAAWLAGIFQLVAEGASQWL